MKKGFIAEGTICNSCEKIIKKQAMKVKGVESVEFDFTKEIGYVTYDEAVTNIDEILYKIEEKGYTCYILGEPQNRNWGWVFVIIGALVVGYFILNFIDGINIPQINQNMGYGLLFIVGLLTGFHCMGMCGGFVISYTTKCAENNVKPHKSHLMYATGKTISYTIIGALFGLMGSVIAFTPLLRGVVGVAAGLFLILYGLKMFNIFPLLRKINITIPKFLWKFVAKEQKKHTSPLIVGLFNGLMIACGPLQAIYIMAAGTGSMVEGAKLLLVFGLGTLPVMISFGYFISIVSSKIANKIVKFSGVVVIVLGLIMVNNGFVLSGSGYDFQSIIATVRADKVTAAAVANSMSLGDYQEIKMEVNRYGWNPDKFVLKKGVPVKWIIEGKEINSCNNAIQVHKYGINFDIKPGQQIIEFTPKEEGIIRWSCWMGMIPGTFIVKDDIDLSDTVEVQKELDSVAAQPRGSCGGGCANPACGAARSRGCGCAGV